MENPIDNVKNGFWQKIIENKYGKWVVYLVVAYSLGYTFIEKTHPIYKFFLPKINYVLGIKPNPDTILVQRNAFFAGLYVHEIHDWIKRDNLDDWYVYYRGDVSRLFGSLEAIGIRINPESKRMLDEKISIIDRLYLFYDLRNQIEPLLESKGIGVKSIYDASFYLSVAANANDTSAHEYAKIATNSLKLFMATFPYKLPSLPIMQVNDQVGTQNGLSMASKKTIIKLKDYFNGNNREE